MFDAQTDSELEQLLPQANFCNRANLDEGRVAPVSRGLRSTAVAHQIEGVAMLVLTGNFIGYLPEGIADIWVRQGRMQAIGNGRFDQQSQIKVVRRRGEEPKLVNRTFLDLLVKARR